MQEKILYFMKYTSMHKYAVVESVDDAVYEQKEM